MKSDYIKRYIFLIVGLAIMAFGVGFSIKADLGTSPISSVPYAVNLVSSLSVGTATIIMHCVFIFLQIIILRKKYEIVQLLQLPVALIFGVLTDLALVVLTNISYTSYLSQWLLCIVGIVLVAIGVSIEVCANVVTLAGEGLVIAICKVAPIKFGNMKICFDVTLVVIAIVIGFVFKHQLLGVREGTIAAAVFVGMLSKVFCIPIKRLID